MGNKNIAPRFTRTFSRRHVEDYKGQAPPQQIIMDPNADYIMQNLIAASSTEYDLTDHQQRKIECLSLGGMKSVGAAIAIRKSSIAMQLIGHNQFSICFDYSSRGPATVSFLFEQKLGSLFNGIPQFTKPNIRLGPIDIPEGKNLKYQMDASLVKKYPKLTLSSCVFRPDRTFVPILIVLESKNEDYVIYIMAGLAMNESTGGYDLIVTKQRVKQGNRGYQIQEIYGLNASRLRSGEERPRENDTTDDESNHLCVICLTQEKDTFVMPCRHMCLCSSCATTMAQQHQNCPICRSAIFHIISMRQHNAE